MPATRQKKNLERLVLEMGHEEGKRKKRERNTFEIRTSRYRERRGGGGCDGGHITVEVQLKTSAGLVLVIAVA